MEHKKLIEFLGIIEKLKCNTRHCWTCGGRQESVAEHCFRLSVMAMLCRDEYPHIDMLKLLKMCLIHDFGEALTGDVPAFYKTKHHELEENRAISELLQTLPDNYREELSALFCELKELKTDEAKLCKALDKMETLISHNESPLDTWLELEYEKNLTYGAENVEWSEWTKQLKQQIKKDSLEKINANKPRK